MFVTSPDQVLSGYVSDVRSVILRIYDYDSSELLFQFSRDNVSKHFIMDWQSNGVVVEIQFPPYYYYYYSSYREFKIFLASHPSKYKIMCCKIFGFDKILLLIVHETFTQNVKCTYRV